MALSIVLGAIAVFAAANTALADTVALTFTGGFPLDDDPTIGWVFSTNTSLRVTELGYFDELSNGLSSSHDVAIWRLSDQAQLVTGLVPSGVAAPLQNGFRFVNIADYFLPVGTYVIGANKPTSGDPHMSNVLPGNMVVAPELSFVENRYIFDGAAFDFPTNTYLPQELGYFGPTFKFGPIPEPTSAGLLLVGGLAAIACRLRR
jgi:hypothetical protein